MDRFPEFAFPPGATVALSLSAVSISMGSSAWKVSCNVRCQRKGHIWIQRSKIKNLRTYFPKLSTSESCQKNVAG